MTKPDQDIPVACRVLVVEDEARLCELWRRALTEMGLYAVAVRSGEAALAAARQEAFGLVLLDLNLPGIDGMEVFRELRRISPMTGVIVVTGFGTLEAAREAVHLDAVEFLAKPVSLGDLEKAIDRHRRRTTAGPGSVSAEPGALPGSPAGVSAGPLAGVSPGSLEDIERQSILAALEEHGGNRAAVARALGISLRKLYYRLAQYQQQGSLPLDED